LVFLAGCSGTKTSAATGKGPGGRGDMAVPVSVARASQKDVPIQAQVIGSTEAYSTVSLKAQINGQLMEVHFREGDFVEKGQLLFTVDPRAVEAQVKQIEANILRDQAQLGQAEANLGRDRAMEANSKSQAERAGRLFKEGIMSKEQFDQISTSAASYAAVVRADLAAIENAKAQIEASKASLENQKVQVGYTKIYAPVGGRTGAIAVKAGNIVTANTLELASINQVQPVLVSFALPENYLAAVRRHGGKALPVTVQPEDGGGVEKGNLTFVDNTVDISTGTIRLKATFANSDRRLWPGQFVRVTLELENRPNAVVIPSQAVQSGQDGAFVYIVSPEQKVEIRNVSAGQRMDQETVIEKGLEPGETVVTEGTLRLVPGARVQVRDPNAPGGPGGPGGPRGRGGKKS
jgi:multidrug efflux system membrane fusion protein